MTENSVVVDTSLVLKWIFNEPDSNKALALLARWTKERVVIRVPPLLIYEATNALHHKDCPLWTADTRMWRAVKDQLDWVHWIGEYTVS